MLLMGIDLGTSSVKVSVVDSQTQKVIAAVQYPETETPITSKQNGWAEQSPDLWWLHVQQAILKANHSKLYNPADIAAIGIAYQMHGLVVTDENQQPLRDAIIWCDSRAVEIGERAFQSIGQEKSLSHLLNSPGNFTASKLAWVKEHEPELYQKIHQVMLPGDFIAMRLTGTVTTSSSALSEGMFWDFKNHQLSADILEYFGFDKKLFAPVLSVFSEHGRVKSSVAAALGLKPGIPVSYKSGDQPNNALSLNVLEPGEVAATAGTSGVIYGVSDTIRYDRQSRVNTFAHVNHHSANTSLGVLLCINGTGILNNWAKNNLGVNSYSEMNRQAAAIAPGSSGLMVLPFGNGAERMLENKNIGAHFHNINFNLHQQAHIFRAIQEGIAFAFRYGLDILRENGIKPSVIRAGRNNLFLSDVFTEAFVNTCNVPVEFFNNDGSAGAAFGAGIGAKVFATGKEAFSQLQPIGVTQPTQAAAYEKQYQIWKQLLINHLRNHN